MIIDSHQSLVSNIGKEPPAGRVTIFFSTSQALFRLQLFRRLLLRQAVQRAEAQHQIDGMNADDGTVREKLSQGAQRDAVVGVVEGGNQDGSVRDVEVGVAGGQPLAVEVSGAGMGSATTSGFEPSSSRKSWMRSQFSASGR